MANGVWIPCHNTIREHWKTYALAKSLNLRAFGAVGIIMSLSVWACDTTEDGNIARFPPEAIARAVDWDGDPKALLGALEASELLDRDGENLFIHDFKDYAGKVIEGRKKARDKKRAQRQKQASESEHLPSIEE